MIANYSVDLHSHTYLSDGADSIFELIVNAVDRGLKVLALTDHDILPPAEIHLPGGGSHSVTAWAREKGLCLIRGVEFSCESELEDVHIVCLGCDWNNKEIRDIEKQIAGSKAAAYTETIKRLNERGYEFEIEELLKFGEHPVDLYALQKKRIFDFLAAKGFVPDWVHGKLLVRDDEYLNVRREKPSAEYVIDVVHRNGGIAILAHPFLIDPEVEIAGKKMSRWEYIEALAKSGLDGIEARYPYGKTTCKEKRPCAEIWKDITDRFAGKLLLSGGSDYHADWKKNNKNPRDLGECGLIMEEFFSEPRLKKIYDGIMDG